ncbi:MAG TPA: hypothetical protein VK912_19140 [Longimicrobiales bacterium]|nr:hypothetical protein [Longimicrobiales bacterium]
MRHSRFLIATGYWLALLLLVLPLLERVVTVLPFSPRAIRWRLEAFGALSQVLLLPLLGGVVAVGTAYLLGHRKVVRTLAISAYVAAVILVVLATLFGLDLLQYRRSIDAEMQQFYDVAGLVYLGAFMLSIMFLVWVGAVAWRAAGHTRRLRRLRVRKDDPPEE